MKKVIIKWVIFLLTFVVALLVAGRVMNHDNRNMTMELSPASFPVITLEKGDIVYNELLVRGYNVDVGIVDVFAKNSEGKRVHKQLEVDFVVNQGSQRYYIQVAYDMTSKEKQIQELNSFRNIPDSFKKIVIVNGSKKPWRNEEGFVIMGMKYFLLNADSLEF